MSESFVDCSMRSTCWGSPHSELMLGKAPCVVTHREGLSLHMKRREEWPSRGP